MTKIAEPVALRPGAVAGSRVISTWDDLIEMGVSVGEIVRDLGMTADAVVKAARRRNRADIVDAVKAWKIEDGDRLRRATGLRWW